LMPLMSYPSGRRAERNLFLTAAFVALPLSSAAYFADFPFFDDAQPIASVDPANALVPAQETAMAALPPTDDRPLVNSAPVLSLETFNLVHNPSLAPTFSQFTAQGKTGLTLLPFLPADAASPSESVETDRPPSVLAAMVDTVEREPVPLPVPRPAGLRASAPQLPEPPRNSRGAAPVPMKSTAVASAPPDDRSLLEKLFGLKPASPPNSALGYASLDSSTGTIAPSARLNSSPNLTEDAATAVYDISAKVVLMPNGDRLEAHSGLGEKLDDPRYVNVLMRGATPPGTYNLTEREKLFHGVRALRMNPIGGRAAIYGRVGLLAHTYMLGPNGDSNGCVSFKDYDRFLQAYLRGEVKRLVVVLGRGQDVLPRVATADNGK
jgi:hypothetical protein